MSKNVLIVACLKDDDDKEMWRMTNAIAEHEKTVQKNTATIVKFSEMSPTKYAHTSIDGKKFNELIITGHSRFFPNNTSFHNPDFSKLKGLLLKDRRIGGYEIEKIAPFIVYCILVFKVNEISIWCCESALDINTYTRKEDPSEVIVDISTDDFNKLLADSKTEVGQQQVSTVGAITVSVAKELKANNYNNAITIKGMNGVGYISSEKPDIVTFDQKNLAELKKVNDKEEALNKINNPKMIPKAKAELEKTKKEFIENYVNTKKSAHIFGYSFNPSTFPTALSTANSVFPWAPSGLNYALANEPVLLNGMKVIFDQPVGLYPVNLESKEEARRNGA